MMKFIEFAGPSCIGKSTVAKRYVSNLDINVVHSESFLHNKSCYFYMVILPLTIFRSTPHILFLVSFFFKYSRKDLKNVRVLLRLMTYFIKYESYKFCKVGLVVQEGALHSLIGIEFKQGFINEAYRDFLKRHKNYYSIFIYFDIDYRTLEARYVARCLFGKNESEKTVALKHYKKVFDRHKELKMVLENDNNSTVLFVDGAKPIDEKVEEIEMFINKSLLQVSN